ncbi:FimV/HubP family polar landmark protein [Rhodoferax aquaticus]|uniref:FimV/HubP family polar landmark protein n=1 Tax=Rhodoferax aquaticus TaxID=2527691 RepID=UPI001F2AD490|nr:FimV/HubP family polar landmark protein [Rhodoferax aquaticus]
MGRLTVQSALGEPLRAEIDVPDINAEEAASLKTAVAAPTAFTAAGLEYNPALSNLQVSLQRRADGRAYIKLSSDRPINDPFVDMILETSWSSGRIVRDYTMLFDPPSLKQQAPNPTLAQTSPAVQVAPKQTTADTNASDASRPAESSTTATAKASKPLKIANPTEPVSAADSDKTVTVKKGDTASKIANVTKAEGVSLDQMLVALLRANPDAFVKGNINRIRSGAVMNVPSSEQALSVPAAEASQTVLAQSKDFNTFRTSLANNAPVAAVVTADRKASGSIEAKVEDKKPVSGTPDKLSLSKGSVQAKAAEEQIAKDKAAKDASARTAELNKNIEDLKKIGASTAPVAAAPAESKPAAPAVAAAPPVAIAAAPAPTPPPAPQPEAAAAPAEPVAAPTAPAAPVVPKPPAEPTPVEEPSIVDELLENPLLPAAAGGLIALLGGFAFWRIRQRKKDGGQIDSSFLESRLQPDSFFGASGGQRVDTNHEASLSGSSMVYSPSQLDAADDVDPVAEADVYLAYGRDLQAEEILKEAVRTSPGRLAIHTKLLEIFAKRRDLKSFETTAKQVFKLTGRDATEWSRVCEMGQEIDPSNPLYQPGGQPDGEVVPSIFGNLTTSAAPAAQAAGVDLDLDLDFSLDETPHSAAAAQEPVAHAKHEQTVQLRSAEPKADIEMDFELSGQAPLASPLQVDANALPDLALSMEGLGSLPASGGSAAPTAKQEAPTVDFDSGMLEFDLGSLSMDLDTPAAQAEEAPVSESGSNPLETKLALAEEFVSIGDEDGARALIEEVIAESTGEMRAMAQRALANLS